MPVIMCENYKHVVILYNVIFSNMTSISYYSYRSDMLVYVDNGLIHGDLKNTAMS